MLKAVCGLFAAILVTSLAGAASAQVVNGDFEAGGGLAPWVGPSWSAAGMPRSGSTSAAIFCSAATCLDAGGASSLSQTVSVTPGASYTLSFWYLTSSAIGPFELQALWSNGAPTNGGAGTCSGSCVAQTTTSSGAWPAYVQVTQTVVATGPNMTLSFLGRDASGFVLIDDVSLTFLSPPTPTVPTLSEWALVVFGLLLAGAAVLIARRRDLARAR